MSIRGIEAGKAYVKFILDSSQYDKELVRIGDGLKKFGSYGVAATAPLIAGFTASLAAAVSLGGAIDDAAKRTGLSVESISELGYAAQQTGTDMGVIEKATRALQAKGIDPLKFDEIAADLSQITDHTERAKATMEIFGTKAGSAIMPLLDNLPQLREEARRLNIIWSAEGVAAADALGDAFDASKQQFMFLLAQIGVAIAGPLTEFLQWSQGIVSSLIDFVHENPGVVKAVAAITAAVAAGSAALIGFGTVLTIITFHPIVAALALIAAAVAGIATYFGLASDGAGEFKTKLDGIKAPSAGQNAVMTQQAQATQRQLQSVMGGGGGVARSAIGPTAAAAAHDATAEIAKWTKESADTLKLILQQLRYGTGSNMALEAL